MRGYQAGYAETASHSGELTDEEIRAAEAVGELIAFWGFKKGHGQIWTLLYLRDAPMTAKQIQTAFSLSKGGRDLLH